MIGMQVSVELTYGSAHDLELQEDPISYRIRRVSGSRAQTEGIVRSVLFSNVAV